MFKMNKIKCILQSPTVQTLEGSNRKSVEMRIQKPVLEIEFHDKPGFLSGHSSHNLTCVLYVSQGNHKLHLIQQIIFGKFKCIYLNITFQYKRHYLYKDRTFSSVI